MDYMDYVGKYEMVVHARNSTMMHKILIRNYYDGSLHGMLIDNVGGIHLLKDLTCVDETITFTSLIGTTNTKWHLVVNGNSVQGTTVSGFGTDNAVIYDCAGLKTEITEEDDGTDRDKRKKKALILYTSITGNTEKVANWFKVTLEHYDMEVTMVKITNRTDWESYEGKLYIEDYDVVCLGSLIIGGSPPIAIIKTFSGGAAGALEAGVTKNAEAGKNFNACGAGGPIGQEVTGADASAPKNVDNKDIARRIKHMWHRPERTEGKLTYPAGPDPHGLYYPLGIVFATYGGGFRGPDEALPVLEMLKLYLELKGVKVIGRFACCGKEFGPAGLADGELPKGVDQPPVFYKDADGNYHAGSFFWHAHFNSRPNARDEATAKAFIANIVEDHFYTADGERRDLGSQYISIC